MFLRLSARDRVNPQRVAGPVITQLLEGKPDRSLFILAVIGQANKGLRITCKVTWFRATFKIFHLAERLHDGRRVQILVHHVRSTGLLSWIRSRWQTCKILIYWCDCLSVMPLHCFILSITKKSLYYSWYYLVHVAQLGLLSDDFSGQIIILACFNNASLLWYTCKSRRIKHSCNWNTLYIHALHSQCWTS